MTTDRFRYSASIVKTSHLLLGLGALLLFLLATSVILVLPDLADGDLRALIRHEDGSLKAEPVMMLIALAIGIMVAWANHQVSLELTGDTLKLHIPRLTGLGMMGLTTGDHRIPLSSIQRVELIPATGSRNMAQAINQSRLNLVTAKQTVRLQPCNFLRKDGPDHRLGLGGAFGKPKARIETLLAEAPLAQALTAAVGEEKLTSESTERSGPLADHFNLLHHRGMVALLILLTALGVYALVDYLMLTNILVLGNLPLWPFVSSALITGVIGIRLGKGAPAAERLGVTALLVLAAAAATYPGIQRYTLMASEPAETVEFEVAETAYFVSDRYPAIDQRQSNITEFWQQYEPGTGYPFRVYPPVIGFALVDLEPVYQRSRAFYQAHNP